jgi:hypothetical protein
MSGPWYAQASWCHKAWLKQCTTQLPKDNNQRPPSGQGEHQDAPRQLKQPLDHGQPNIKHGSGEEQQDDDEDDESNGANTE